jgi:hypothetical protein
MNFRTTLCISTLCIIRKKTAHNGKTAVFTHIMGAYCEEMRPLKGYIKHCISKNNLKTNFKGSFMNMNRFVLYCLGFTLLIDLTGMAKDYNGAELYSNNTVKYGRFDIRMRTISGNGTVSSFFLY